MKHAPTHDLRLVLDTNTVMALWLFRDPALAALAAHCEAPGCVLLGRAAAQEEQRPEQAKSPLGVPAQTPAAQVLAEKPDESLDALRSVL